MTRLKTKDPSDGTPANGRVLDATPEPVPKRKRVSKACETCRAKKARCDSRRPVCGRCKGYGFQCLWGADKRRDGSHGSSTPQTHRRAAHNSLDLIRNLCSALPEDARTAVDDIVTQLQADAAQPDAQRQDANRPPASAAMFIDQPHSSQYLGKGSDGHFLNRAGDTTMGREPGALDVEDLQQVEQRPSQPVPDAQSWAAAEKCLLAYFSSVHTAYPFLPQSYCMGKFKASFLDGAQRSRPTEAWLALLYGAAAVGGLYLSLAGQDEAPHPLKHQSAQYFRRSVSLTNFSKLEASAVQISALLVQCFYLLATSRTDSCWITLGVAIRLAQALGLHADFPGGTRSWSYPLPVSQRLEIRRRVWYSLYVLDRLLALQVGRPPAIADSGFRVTLPSNLDDSSHDWEADVPVTGHESPSKGDYFLQVIGLSSLIGIAEANLNEPPKTGEAASGRLRRLDGDLFSWKKSLPRYLRFDIAHLFDKSPHFQRQRNMLAMKYHHVRALMYRPFLDLPAANLDPSELSVGDQMAQPRASGEVCVSEARQIARLFHGIQDPPQLIVEYPWWQLVSCVMCAASILIVAHALDQSRENSDSSLESLEDANTCIEVLGALSKTSRAAQRARDSLVKLLSQFSTSAASAYMEGTGASSEQYQAHPAVQYEQSEGASVGCGTVGDDLSFCWPTGGEMDFASGSYLPWQDGTFEPVIWSSQLLEAMALPEIAPGPPHSTYESVSRSIPGSNEQAHGNFPIT